MTTRRDFLKTGAALGALSLLPAGFACSPSPKEKAIGLQLYSLRDDIQRDAAGTIKAAIAIGYKRLEFYGYQDGKFFGQTPKEMKQFLADLGAAMTGSHINMSLLDPEADNTAQWGVWKKSIEDAAEAGCKWVVEAAYPVNQIESISDVMRLADQFNRCGELVKAGGLRFAFHSQFGAFRDLDGQIPYDVLIVNTDKDLVTFQIDTEQMIYGSGIACHEYVKRYPGRFSNWHLKDAAPNGGSTEFGKGIMDFEALFAVADIAKLEDYYVEQEIYNMTPLESMKYNYDFLMNAPYVKW